MIRKILVALDGSPRAPNVLATATSLASAIGAEMTLLRAVMIPPDFPPAGHVTHPDSLPQHMLTSAEAELRHLADQAGARVSRVLVRHGQAWRVIVSVADELDVDLVIVGSHGYHGLDRILGTTSGKVANLAHRNVMVVHSAERDSAT